MSSLGLSLLLLVALAVGVALAYNLRQAWPRWRYPQAVRWLKMRRERPGAGAQAGSVAPQSRRTPSAAGRSAPDDTGAARGEPRLGATPVVDEGGPAASSPEALQASRTAARPAIRDTRGAIAPATKAAAPEDAGAPESAATAPFAQPAASPSPGASAAPTTVAAAAPAGIAQPRLSEICDCIVEISPAEPFGGERLTAIAQRFRRAGGKPIIVEGQAADAAPGDWSVPDAARQYAALRVGILLANRHGPLNAMEFSEFATGLQAIAESLAALADTPDMSTVLARARDLDATCAQLDAQISLNVDAPEAVSPAQLAALAGVLSIAERGSNRYARLGPQGELVFSVALSDLPNRFTFLLDVPRSSPQLQPWTQMLATARACAQQVGGELVDDGGRVLAEAALAQIGRQLVQRYESLEAIGLPAGSALALRVFN